VVQLDVDTGFSSFVCDGSTAAGCCDYIPEFHAITCGQLYATNRLCK